MISESPTTLKEIPQGARTALVGSMEDVDLVDAGYTQAEWHATGTANGYGSSTPLVSSGRWDLEVVDRAAFTTRFLVRMPADPQRSSGTVIVEWLNVSSGADACPVFGSCGREIVRSGHTWIGISAQWAGIASAPRLVDVGGLALRGLQDTDPERYGDLNHPGDLFSFDIFTRVAAAATAPGAAPLAGRHVGQILAVGQSQSADALTTYVNGIHPQVELFDGFLIVSREGAPMPLGRPGCAVDFSTDRSAFDVQIRSDLDTPVHVVQSETDVLGYLYSFPSRQPDTDRLRLWEVAGTAHVDRSVIGEFEGFLGCDEPVNRGQLRFVVRSALRHLTTWANGGAPPPSADPLVVEGEPTGSRRDLHFVTDDVGNAVGGVRTPCVDVAVETLSGLTAPQASTVCQLFGRTSTIPSEVLRARYSSVDNYLAGYAMALDKAIEGGFILADDRGEVLADARTGLVVW